MTVASAAACVIIIIMIKLPVYYDSSWYGRAVAVGTRRRRRRRRRRLRFYTRILYGTTAYTRSHEKLCSVKIIIKCVYATFKHTITILLLVNKKGVNCDFFFFAEYYVCFRTFRIEISVCTFCVHSEGGYHDDDDVCILYVRNI